MTGVHELEQFNIDTLIKSLTYSQLYLEQRIEQKKKNNQDYSAYAIELREIKDLRNAVTKRF